MHVLHRAGKLGLGTATIAAMKYAIEHDYDYLLNLDADFSHHPRLHSRLLAGMDHADVMIGSRVLPRWRRERLAAQTRLMSQA